MAMGTICRYNDGLYSTQAKDRRQKFERSRYRLNIQCTGEQRTHTRKIRGHIFRIFHSIYQTHNKRAQTYKTGNRIPASKEATSWYPARMALESVSGSMESWR